MESTQEKSAPKMIRKPRTITESSSSSDTSSSSFSSSTSSADMMEAMDRIALEWGQEEETEEEFELRRRLDFAQWYFLKDQNVSLLKFTVNHVTIFHTRIHYL